MAGALITVSSGFARTLVQYLSEQTMTTKKATRAMNVEKYQMIVMTSIVGLVTLATSGLSLGSISESFLIWSVLVSSVTCWLSDSIVRFFAGVTSGLCTLSSKREGDTVNPYYPQENSTITHL